MDFDIQSLLYLGGIGLIVGLVQVAKMWVSDTRWYPLIAMGLGVLINMVIGLNLQKPEPVVNCIFMGIIAGLAAGGLYSAGATLREGKAAEKKEPNHAP